MLRNIEYREENMIDKILNLNIHNQQVRAIKVDDEFWYLGQDVRKLLKLNRRAFEFIDSKDKRTVRMIQGEGTKGREIIVVNKMGLLNIIGSSQFADEFKQYIKEQFRHEEERLNNE